MRAATDTVYALVLGLNRWTLASKPKPGPRTWQGPAQCVPIGRPGTCSWYRRACQHMVEGVLSASSPLFLIEQRHSPSDPLPVVSLATILSDACAMQRVASGCFTSMRKSRLLGQLELCVRHPSGPHRDRASTAEPVQLLILGAMPRTRASTSKRLLHLIPSSQNQWDSSK